MKFTDNLKVYAASSKETCYITSLSSDEAMDYLMKSEQYHNIELPEYFEFDTILKYVRNVIGDQVYEKCIVKKGFGDNINFDILLNKDGRYAVRPVVLCNPYLYYFLSRQICGKDNWETIKENFSKCTVPHIVPCALPVIAKKPESFHKATAILNWWNTMEQRSIELSLEYRYMFVTDITNCYGSVDPQTIDWALSRKNTCCSTDTNHVIAMNIIKLLCEFQQGRNIGIPQGSTLFDLTAEIILCYSDLLLHESLEKQGIIDGYEILRYRDDYRIFCNDKDKLETISYTLQKVLGSLNFRMNSSKTSISDSIITDSIKPDKLFYIFNTPIFNKKGCDFDGIQKHLLYILLFARKYPNSGQIKNMLSDIDKRIEEKLKPRENTVLTFEDSDAAGEKKVMIPGRILENKPAICAIATQIAIENISVIHYALRVISRIVSSIEDMQKRGDIISKVSTKLINLPNSTYAKLWLQNMTYNYDVETNCNDRYDISLCKLVMGEKVELWNNKWLKPSLRKDFPLESVINKETLAKVTPIITFRETRAYDELLYDLPDDIQDDFPGEVLFAF